MSGSKIYTSQYIFGMLFVLFEMVDSIGPVLNMDTIGPVLEIDPIGPAF